jgi:hypothetical protein
MGTVAKIAAPATPASMIVLMVIAMPPVKSMEISVCQRQAVPKTRRGWPSPRSFGGCLVARGFRIDQNTCLSN